jgi:hypothetical protein
MSENVGASNSRNPTGLHGLYRINLPHLLFFLIYIFLRRLCKAIVEAEMRIIMRGEIKGL